MPYGSKKIGIERLHLEQDAGKSIHDLSPDNTYVDLNRSGVALMEIVSKPDLRSPEEVNSYVKKLRSIMRYLGTCDGNMQEGSLRADVNVSVRKKGETKFGTRCEIKNVNSIKFMEMATAMMMAKVVDTVTSEKSNNRAMKQKQHTYEPMDTRMNTSTFLGNKRRPSVVSPDEAYATASEPDAIPIVISKTEFAVCRLKSWSKTVWKSEEVTPGPTPPVTKTWYFFLVVEPDISS